MPLLWLTRSPWHLDHSKCTEKMMKLPQEPASSNSRRTLLVSVSQGQSQPSSQDNLQLREATLAAAPGVRECHILATSKRPGLLETHFFSSGEFPSTLFSCLFFPECTAQGLWLRSQKPRTQIYVSDRLGHGCHVGRILDPVDRFPCLSPVLQLRMSKTSPPITPTETPWSGQEVV